MNHNNNNNFDDQARPMVVDKNYGKLKEVYTNWWNEFNSILSSFNLAPNCPLLSKKEHIIYCNNVSRISSVSDFQNLCDFHEKLSTSCHFAIDVEKK